MKLFSNKYRRTGIAVVIALFIILIMQFTGALTPIREVETEEINNIPCEGIIGEITKEVTIRQQFVYTEDTLESFSVRAATYGGLKQGNLSVVLTDVTDKKKIQEYTIETKELTDNSFSNYILNEKLNNVKGHTFEITFTSDAIAGNAITLWKNNQNLYEGNLSYNNQKQEGQINLVFNTMKTLSRVNYVYAFIAIFTLLFLVFSLIQSKPWKKTMDITSLAKLKQVVKRNRKKVLGFICTEIVLFAISIFAENLLSSSNLIQPNTIGAFNEYRFAFIFVCLSVVAVFIFAKDLLEKKPEIVGLLLILGIGCLFVFSLPSEIFASWDEGIHYWRSVSLSHAISGYANSAEYFLYQADGIHPENFKSIGQLAAAQEAFQNMYQMGETVPIDASALSSVWTIAYLPSAIALFIGRFLQLPYLFIYHMGTFANFAFYAMLVYYAMKKVKSGKMIIFVIATMTTTMFLSARYSYDTWVIAFFILGMAYFLSAMQRDEKLENSELIVMLGAFFVGAFPKAVYFPVLLCLLFLPKQKFISAKQREKFKISVLACSGALALSMLSEKIIVLLIALIILYPVIYICYFIIKKLTKKQITIIALLVFVIVGTSGIYVAFNIVPSILGVGDVRGGAVNAAQQFIGILQNPAHYFKILFDFLTKDYLATGWTTNFSFMAYLGASTLNTVPMLLLFFVAITDKNRFDCWKRQWKVRIIMSILILAAICLIATALYIDFTPYGLEQINGCSPRYLLPLFLPLFGLIGSSKIQNYMNRRWYNGIIMALCCCFLLINIWQILIGSYY